MAENIKDDRGYNQVWADNKSARVRAERRCEYMLSLMNIGADKSVMEIGCGSGKNSFLISKKTPMQVLGTDLCLPFIEGATKDYSNENLRFEQLDFTQVNQFKGERFDYIIGNGILHHLYHNLDESFMGMKSLLKKNGKIIFLEPNIYNPYIYLIFSYSSLRKKAHLEPDEMAFSKSFIVEKLQKCGYTNIEVEYKDFLLPGIPDFCIKPSIWLGNILEKTPLIKMVSQSIYISAEVE